MNLSQKKKKKKLQGKNLKKKIQGHGVMGGEEINLFQSRVVLLRLTASDRCTKEVGYCTRLSYCRR